MAAIGETRANDLINEARAAGMTDEQITAAIGCTLDYVQYQSKAGSMSLVRAIENAQARRPRTTHTRTTRRGSHPLGTAVDSGDGYTIYDDTAFGGGRRQIWDQS